MKIRLMTAADEPGIAEMMRVFYGSPAVSTNGSDEIFHRDIKACVTNNPYAEGYVFEEDHRVIGYGMIAKSFSTEFGKPCIWIEDLYLKEEYRGKGFGSAFLQFIRTKYADALLRLEAEEANAGALKTYRNNGFLVLPYTELYRN